MAARSMSPRSMVAVVVEENMMAIVTREAVVPVVIVEGSIVAKQGDFLSWPSNAMSIRFLGTAKKNLSIYLFMSVEKFRACCIGSNMIT